MRRIATTTGVGVLLLLTAACAQGGDSGKEAQVQPGNAPALSTSTPNDGSDTAPGHVAPKGATSVSDAQVDASKLPKDYPRQVWTQQGGKTVVAYGQEGGCDTLKLTVAYQSTKEVHLRFLEKAAKKGTMCTLQLKETPLSVSLDKPLGERRIVLDTAKLPIQPR